MGSLYQQIDACLAQLGSDGFAPVFCDLVEMLGVDQLMVFTIGEDRATCLLSRHFRNRAMAEKLAATYLDGWFRKDPLLPELMALPSGAVALRDFDAIEKRMDDEYRHIFFDSPGLMTKTTVMCAGTRLRLFVSLYRQGNAEWSHDDDLARLAGRLALLHYDQAQAGDIPAPLAVLSDRERAVCLGILSGRKAEAIAAELDLAASTVVTYRKRAYDKLGVSSRSGLFAICGK